MSDLVERLHWVLIEHRDKYPSVLLNILIKELETTHRICDPEVITEEMLEACFNALPAHYDPPDPKRRPWHAFKAKRRYTSMVKAVGSILK